MTVNCNNIPGLDEIDFEKNTLLIITGVELYRNQVSETIFIQTGNNKYRVNIIFSVELSAAITPWQAAILIPKLHKKAQIKFVKEYNTQF